MKKTIYVITEYGVVGSEDYYNTHVFGTQEEAFEEWDRIKKDMEMEAESHDLEFVEYGKHYAMEYFERDDPYGNFHKSCFDTKTINIE